MKSPEMGGQTPEREPAQIELLKETWGVMLVRKDGKPYLINMGRSSLDLMQQGYSDEKGEFDLAKYFSVAEQSGRVVEIDEDDISAVSDEIDEVSEDRYAKWPTVQKYLDQIQK